MTAPTQSKQTKDSSQQGSLIQTRARTLLTLFIVGLGIFLVRDFISSFLWGGVLAIASWPLYHKAESILGKNSWLPAVLTSLFALAVLIPLILISFQIIDETVSLITFIKQARDVGIPQPEWVSQLPSIASPLQHWWNQHLANPEELSLLLKSFKFGQSIEFTRQISAQAVKRGMEFTFALITFFFLLKDGHSIIEHGLVGSRRLFGRQGEVLARQIIASVHGTLSGLVLVGFAEGAVMGVIYVFVHASQPLLFGFVTAIAAMIPMMGIITVGIVALLLLLQAKVIGAALTFGIGAVILFFADHFVRPAFIGGTTKLPFLWVLIGILAGAETWGLLGLFLGPAIMSCIYLLWGTYTTNPHKRRTRKKKINN